MNIKLLKRFLLMAMLVLSALAEANAQSPTPYGNEWIDYSKTYYKLKVVNTGLHRLSYGFLDSLGLAGTNPQHFQLFRRGKEVAIHVEGEADGRLDRQDFIEFYGERNDGRLDQDLYKNPAHQIHQLYSLYTDTAAYFLTVNPAGGKRMQQVNPSPAGKTPEPYVLSKVTQFFTGRYYYGRKHGQPIDQAGGIGSLLSWMDEGEGYFDVASSNSTTTKDINLINNLVGTGPKPVLEYAFGSYSVRHTSHNVTINLLSASGGSRVISRFHQLQGDTYARGTTTLELSDIHASGKIVLQALAERSTSRINFSYVKITYPRSTSFEGNSMVFYTDSTRTENPFLEFIGTNENFVSFDITEPYNPVRIVGHLNAGRKGFVIPSLQNSHKVLLVDASRPLKVKGRAEAIRYRNINASAHNYIIITNKRLMKPTAGSQVAAPTLYAAYRASTAGGGYDTLLVHIDQLVDQFHYGEFSSNAIRKFMDFMLTSERPKHLFLIGKGAKYAWDDYRGIRDNHWTGAHNRYSFYHVDGRHPKVYEYDLVPTGLIPASDVFFTADYRNDRYEPRVPTGRLPVTNPQQIIDYLNKVKGHEALPEGLAWRKNILQLGGGALVDDIRFFNQRLTEYKNIAAGPLFGGNIIEKYRQGLSDYPSYVNVTDEVNAGVSLITFFGHSATVTSDIQIGSASSTLDGFRNKDKYPVIMMNGCYSGDTYFLHNYSFGEDWVLTPDRGALAFMAQTYLGGNWPLHYLTENFYKTAYQDEKFYGKTLGEVQKEAIRKYYTSQVVYRNGEHVSTMTQMALQGDPAVKLYVPSKPDYAFDNNNFKLKGINGEVATSVSESLLLELNAINLGKATGDSVTILIKRTLADNTPLSPVVTKVKPIFFKEKIQLVLPNIGFNTTGMNRFEIILDGVNEIDELIENNNTLQFQHFIPMSGVAVLSPANYGIVNNPSVNLVVQSTNEGADPKGVYFELDTTKTFTSRIKKSYQVPAGKLLNWQTDLPIQNQQTDSTVFYWRARFDQFAEGEDTVWVQSSFRYVPNSNGGWSQSHRGQFDEAELDGIKQNATSNKWEFKEQLIRIDLRTVGGEVRFRHPDHGIFFNGGTMIDSGCGNFQTSSDPRVFVYVLDNRDLEKINISGFNPCQWIANLYQFGSLNTASQRTNLQRFLDAVPQNHYVVLVTVNSVPFDLFSSDLKKSFANIGSELITSTLKTGYPYLIIGQKGAKPGTVQELTADLSNKDIPATKQEIRLQHNLETNVTEGRITSTIIGPALSWGSLHHNIERYAGGNDSYKLSLYGINDGGDRNLLHENITSKSFDLSSIDATTYPSLQLQATLTDTEARTAPQLKQWMVYYQAAPEGVIRPDLVEVSEQIISDQASRGAINMPMAFQNVTPYAFRDSITVEVTVTGENMEPAVTTFKIEALEGNKTAKFNFTMPTVALDGAYKLTMYVNPRLQPEQQYQNNIYEVNFAVKSKLHPIMDVAFDGVHIMDGELVAPSPLISITVKDENKHAFLQDPNAMTVYLTDHSTGIDHEIKAETHGNEVRVFPADGKNDFRFEYKPSRLENGSYTLIVQGKDVAGRAAGTKEYKINFMVENESKITNFYPYPNPFSTKTQFIFTLTGGVIPDNFKIQIMTVTGKVVKEITREEIGPIRIGNNKTEYAWDGTDMYGDKLANGVYLYRVVMPKDAEEMKHFWKKGDKGFVNGYGKIYILR